LLLIPKLVESFEYLRKNDDKLESAFEKLQEKVDNLNTKTSEDINPKGVTKAGSKSNYFISGFWAPMSLYVFFLLFLY